MTRKLQGYQVTKLYVMRRDGSESRMLTVTFDRECAAAAVESGWKKNVYFYRYDHGNTGFYSSTLDGVGK